MAENDGKKRFRIGIQGKLLASIILLAVVLCTVCTMSGYYRYQNTIRRMYSDSGYMIGNLILDQLDHDQIGRYARTWTEDENYGLIQDPDRQSGADLRRGVYLHRDRQ